MDLIVHVDEKCICGPVLKLLELPNENVLLLLLLFLSTVFLCCVCDCSCCVGELLVISVLNLKFDNGEVTVNGDCKICEEIVNFIV